MLTRVSVRPSFLSDFQLRSGIPKFVFVCGKEEKSPRSRSSSSIYGALRCAWRGGRVPAEEEEEEEEEEEAASSHQVQKLNVSPDGSEEQSGTQRNRQRFAQLHIL
ncbi:unnamed protein product [Pleuronectes platessa]|uniref:Uncharacterized protein n=1 Tax=Pleuronectes platessa TaxID=8262 RepID=A0A9N7U5U0_PLEPL|nr:unnamed protein product [Pleuronectes platessa]